MGAVYRATDTSLGRQVAIKVLPDAFAHAAERLARFEREAKTLAALNHPHIAAIYGFERSGGTQALVMELVEGEDLSERIARGALPVDEALPIARQIAEALEAAHEQGIIHRDLKPANIKVRGDGTVKVLDFGLAKLNDPNVSNGPNGPNGLNGPNALSPTITSPAMMTGAGIILGTAAYMAPEQARGRAVDKRADIWAFGCVLFEMLTGARAFEGEDVSDTLAVVMRGEPAWDALPAGLPPALVTFLRRCLQKNPAERVRDIGDVRLALGGAFDTVVKHVSSEAPHPAGLPARPLWSVWIYELAGRTAIRRLTFGGKNRAPIWSPDGQWVVFQSDREGDLAMFRQRADGTGVAERVTKPEAGEEHIPQSVSPDGKHLLFTVRKERTYTLRTTQVPAGVGAKAEPFGGVRSERGLVEGVFSPDGRLVAYQEPVLENSNPPVFLQPFPATGAKYLVRQLGGHPYWSPKGDQLILNVRAGQSVIVPVTTTPAVAFGQEVNFPRSGRSENAPTSARRNVDSHPDGEHIVGITNANAGQGASRQITVVLNWFDELRARVPVP
jgi:hypothetical protein